MNTKSDRSYALNTSKSSFTVFDLTKSSSSQFKSNDILKSTEEQFSPKIKFSDSILSVSISLFFFFFNFIFSTVNLQKSFIIDRFYRKILLTAIMIQNSNIMGFTVRKVTTRFRRN